MRSETLELGIIGAPDPSGAEQSQDPRVAGERAEHECDPAVVTQVCDGLDAAAEQIEIGDGVVVDHRERIAISLGGEVDSPTFRGGAVAKKNMARSPMNSRRDSSIRENSFATRGLLAGD